jgi:hypothetical protein
MHRQEESVSWYWHIRPLSPRRYMGHFLRLFPLKVWRLRGKLVVCIGDHAYTQGEGWTHRKDYDIGPCYDFCFCALCWRGWHIPFREKLMGRLHYIYHHGWY